MTNDYKPEIIQIKNKKTGEEKPFLCAHDAIDWFRREFPLPRGQIVTHIIDIEKSLLRCEIFVDDILVASADVRGDGTKSLEKVQTNCVRRALAFAGYGTISALSYESDSQLDESQQARLAMDMEQMDKSSVRDSLGASGNRRVGKSSEPTPKATPPAEDDMTSYPSDADNRNPKIVPWDNGTLERFVESVEERYPGIKHEDICELHEIDDLSGLGNPSRAWFQVMEFAYANNQQIRMTHMSYHIQKIGKRLDQRLEFTAFDANGNAAPVIYAYGRSTKFKSSIGKDIYDAYGFDQFKGAKKTSEWIEMAEPAVISYETESTGEGEEDHAYYVCQTFVPVSTFEADEIPF